MQGRIFRKLPVTALILSAAFACLPSAAAAHDDDATGSVDHRDTPAELAATPIAQEVAAAQLAGADGPLATALALPTGSWCGQATTSDDTADAVYPASAPQFKVIYAYPADRPNRFAQWAGALQANASIIEQYVSLQPGSSRAPRFDLGTSCGQDYLDIQTVALPQARSAYLSNFGAVTSAVAAVVNQNPGGPRNYVILADTLSGGGIFGQGSLLEGGTNDRPTSDNPHNNGGFASVLWVPDGTTAPSAGSAWWPHGMLHEMSHNMGAVQWSAPHTTQPTGANNYTYSHCWDGTDLMCYQDGPAPAHPYTSTVCEATGSASLTAMYATYDCNQDDYFNPAPVAGSYLATHWDLYNSAFMGDCASLGTCPASTPPVNVTAPATTGDAQVGHVLTAVDGSWTGAVDGAYRYRWQRCLTSVCSTISGATASTYTVATADVGYALRVVVTAVNADGATASAPSAQTTVVIAPAVNTTRPAITGLAVQDRTLTGGPGTWSGTVLGRTQQWLRCDAQGAACQAIDGATATTLVLGADDVGHTVVFRVTVSSPGGDVSADSAPTAVVRAPFVNTALPTVSGTLLVGETLTAGAGTWTPAADTVGYQWLRCTTTCSPISGATAATYKLTTSDYNRHIAVTVVPKPDLTPAATSAGTDLVAYPALANTAPPAVTGTTEVGYTLRTTVGTWSRAAAVTSQWRRCQADGSACVDISGARSTSYVLQAADANLKVLVHLVATATADGSVAEVDSVPVTVAAAQPPQPTVAPTVSGTPKRYELLTSTTGSWTGNASTYTRQWLRCTDAGGSSCQEIAAATGATYRLTRDDEGSYVTARVTATGPGGSTSVRPTGRGPVVAAPPVLVTSPTLTSPAVVQQGATLKTSRGTWTAPADTAYVYQWQRCTPGQPSSCQPLLLATGASYVMVSGDIASSLRARVTASNPDASVSSYTPLSATVLPAAPKLSVAPTISGTAKAGQTLTVTQGTYIGEVTTITDAWWRCTTSCVAISAATGRTYQPVTADVGAYLKVREVATGPGGSLAVYTRTVGPVISATSATSTLTAGTTATLRTTTGLTLGTVTVSAPAVTAASVSPLRSLTVRVSPRRAVRVLTCVPPTPGHGPTCSHARVLRHAATFRVQSSGRRVAVTVMALRR